MSRNFIRKLAISSNISTYLSRTLIIITVTTTLLTGGILVIMQTYHFNRLSKQKSQEYINDQKIYIQEIVKNELEYIRIQNENFKQSINHKIKQNVTQAIHTAESIYREYVGLKSEAEIKALIIATISSLKFEMEYEEVFISTMNGTGVYYPRNPEFSGKDMSLFKDANGMPVIYQEIKLLKTENEGFLDYVINSDKITDSAPHKKITFVKKFDHFNWYFGSKQYIDDYFPKFRNEIAQKIATVRFRNGGYVFLNHVNGTPIVMDGKVYNGSLNFLQAKNDLRRDVFVQELDVIKENPEGGFFYYKWNKINDAVPSDKCAYVQQFKEYDWLIGAGFYMDEINQGIVDQQKMLKQDQRRSIIIILMILILLLFLEAAIIYHFNKKYKSDFDRFFNFFFLSQNSFNKLTVSEFYFDEFKRAGVAANQMIMLREETEQRLIEEQKKATEADRLKSAFLANMSHEIRTPMNAIVGFSELLEDGTQDDEDRLVFIKLIRKNGEILLNLINDIIDISKIEANLLSIKKRPFLLQNFLDEIGNHYRELLASKPDKDIRFEITNQIESDNFMQTDETRLRQIIDNLLSNAIKFTSHGSISVDVRKEDDMLHFTISDTGIGIPTEQQSTIFERFMQAEHGQKVNFGGTGLGLAISKNLIELLGGSIEVKSELGKGSAFHFYIASN